MNYIIIKSLHLFSSRLDDPALKICSASLAEAVEEIVALTHSSLCIFTGDEEFPAEMDQRPIIKLTQFGIYDQFGHLCELDGGAIEGNHNIYAYGYVKPVWNDDTGVDGGINTKEIGPINEWFVSDSYRGEKAVMCKCKI